MIELVNTSSSWELNDYHFSSSFWKDIQLRSFMNEERFREQIGNVYQFLSCPKESGHFVSIQFYTKPYHYISLNFSNSAKIFSRTLNFENPKSK